MAPYFDLQCLSINHVTPCYCLITGWWAKLLLHYWPVWANLTWVSLISQTLVLALCLDVCFCFWDQSCRINVWIDFCCCHQSLWTMELRLLLASNPICPCILNQNPWTMTCSGYRMMLFSCLRRRICSLRKSVCIWLEWKLFFFLKFIYLNCTLSVIYLTYVFTCERILEWWKVLSVKTNKITPMAEWLKIKILQIGEELYKYQLTICLL